MIGDEEVRGRIGSMKIGDRVDSDHQPLEIWMEGEVRRKKRNEKQESGKVIWDREGCELFREKLRWEKKEDRGMEEEWGEMEKRMSWGKWKRNRRRGGEEKEDGGMRNARRKKER